MTPWKLRLVRVPVIGKIVLLGYRLDYAMSYYKTPLLNLFKWLFNSNETTNFTYDLSDTNKSYMASMISEVTGVSHAKVKMYLNEIEGDEALKAHISKGIREADLGFMADEEVIFGRRIGWYAFVRAAKPRVVVETGVDKGLGACVITAALLRNCQEGSDGRYYGTDIDPAAGYLLAGSYATKGKILLGDSVESLRKMTAPVDLFINDSDHSAEYEQREYDVIGDKLSSNAIVIGDNAHVTDKLYRFALNTGRSFTYFHERPIGHWYPGGGIGVAYWRRTSGLGATVSHESSSD